jgi:predicted NBD/HSP70 family sugar kinase
MEELIRGNPIGQGENLAIHTILRIIMDSGPVSRSGLCKASGYSPSTISLNCDRLLASGIAVEESASLDGYPSKRTKLRLNGAAGIIVGIELGATSCEIGICDFATTLLDSRSLIIDFRRGPELIIAGICSVIDELCAGSGRSGSPIFGIGIGLPSPVDHVRGVAVHPAFMPGWHLYPVRDILASRYACPVFVDNEVNTMALGEYSLGKEHKYSNLLFIKAGTGIGAGIIVDGAIYRGAKGLSGNLGHIQVDNSDEVCECGNIGCLEAMTGGPAIGRKAEAAARSGRSAILAALLESRGALTARDVKEAADEGDEASLAIIQATGTVLGGMIGKMITFLDPAIVILGGGLMGFGPNFLAYIREAIFRQCSPWIGPDFPVEPSTFGDKSGIIGSAMLCVDSLIEENLLSILQP